MELKSESNVYSLLRLAVNCNQLRLNRKVNDEKQQCTTDTKSVDTVSKVETSDVKKCENVNENNGRVVNKSKKSLNKYSKCLLMFKVVAVITILLFAAFILIPWEEWVLLDASVDDILDATDGEYYEFLATNDQHIPDISLHEVNCSWFGYRRERSIGAAPQRCGTLITDGLISLKEAKRLRSMARRLIDAYGDSSVYNRESLNLKWINFHNIFRKAPVTMFSEKDYNLVHKVSEYVKHTISITFGLPAEKLYFTNVTQFTRHRPLTKFAEFRHVDKLRSPSLVVTSIIWLSTVDVDFYGGRTEFLTGGPEPFTPLLIDPKIGRFAAWTSSYENPHGVHEILAGDRYALIFAFTVNKRFGHLTMDDLKKWSLDPANIPKKTKRTLSFVTVNANYH